MPVTDIAFGALRDRVAEVEQSIAVRDETMKSITSRLDKIETVLSRLTWLMVSGIGMAFVAFVVGGGLAHVPGL